MAQHLEESYPLVIHQVGVGPDGLPEDPQQKWVAVVQMVSYGEAADQNLS